MSHRPLRRLGIALGVFLVVAAGLPYVAGADQIANKQAEAARIARQLDAQGEQVSILAERVNTARLRADRLAAQAEGAKAELAKTDALVRAAKGRLKSQAVNAYVRGGQLTGMQELIGGQPNDIGRRQTYVKTVTGQETSALDGLRNAREQFDAKRAAAEADQAQARAALDQVASARRAAAAAEAATQQTLSQVKGELADLVAAESRRQAEEAARRAQAALAARQSREQTAARSRGTYSGPAPPVSQSAAGAVEEARRQLGKPYQYGAAGPDRFDCSGLMLWSWGHAGRRLSHSAAAQYNETSRVAIADLQPGDLVFFGSPIHHNGMYVGGGQMIEASHSGTPVRYASISRRDYVGAGRVG